MKQWFYKGYALIQGPDCHYMIIDKKTGQWVLHAQFTKRLNKQEAHEHIDFYIEYIASGKLLEGE